MKNNDSITVGDQKFVVKTKYVKSFMTKSLAWKCADKVNGIVKQLGSGWGVYELITKFVDQK